MAVLELLLRLTGGLAPVAVTAGAFFLASEGLPMPTSVTESRDTTKFKEYINKVTAPPPSPVGRRFLAKPRKCKCRFCSTCRVAAAVSLRTRLRGVLHTFTSISMITCTIDPSLFPNAEAAFRHLFDPKAKRLNKIVQRLLAREHPYSGRFFWTIEFQSGGFPQIHVLLDADGVSQQNVELAWSYLRPKDAGVPSPGRPAFGTVWLTRLAADVTWEECVSKAATYVTKTDALVPEWVMKLGAQRRLRSFGTSHGFWPPPKPARRPARSRPRGGRVPRRQAKTYAERAADCGSTVNLFSVHELVDRETGEIQRKWCFAAEVVVGEASRLTSDPRQITASTIESAVDLLQERTGQPVSIIRLGRTNRRAA